MQVVKFKTNILDEVDRLQIAAYLNNAVGIANWQIDISSTDKTLMVYSPSIVNETQVLDAVNKAGFRAVNIDEYYAIY